MTSLPPATLIRDAAHERRVLLDLAAHHDALAAGAVEDDARADHRRAAESCRTRAEQWRAIGEISALIRARVAAQRGGRK